MQQISVQPHQTTLFMRFTRAAKPVSVVAVAIYAIGYFTAPYWLLLGALLALALAFMQRVKTFESQDTEASQSGKGIAFVDGGAFRKGKSIHQAGPSRPVVCDGGSFERGR
ncbi:MAG: hypothetical protein PVG66_10950 [Chromatiales bacterium]|jgi:hypothetical protein